MHIHCFVRRAYSGGKALKDSKTLCLTCIFIVLCDVHIQVEKPWRIVKPCHLSGCQKEENFTFAILDLKLDGKLWVCDICLFNFCYMKYRTAVLRLVARPCHLSIMIDLYCRAGHMVSAFGQTDWRTDGAWLSDGLWSAGLWCVVSDPGSVTDEWTDRHS